MAQEHNLSHIVSSITYLKSSDCAKSLVHASYKVHTWDVELLSSSIGALKLPEQLFQQRKEEAEMELSEKFSDHFATKFTKCNFYKIYWIRESDHQWITLQLLLIWMQRDYFKSIFNYVMMKLFQGYDRRCDPPIKFFVQQGVDFSYSQSFYKKTLTCDFLNTLSYLREQAAILQSKLSHSLSSSLIPEIIRDVGAFVIFVD
jgi:hypothetical protein